VLKPLRSSGPAVCNKTFRNVEADKFYLIEEGVDRLNPQRIAGRPRANALKMED